jgi:ribosomal protein L21E
VKDKLPDLPVNNFTSDWNNGKAVGALVRKRKTKKISNFILHFTSGDHIEIYIISAERTVI